MQTITKTFLEQVERGEKAKELLLEIGPILIHNDELLGHETHRKLVNLLCEIQDENATSVMD